MVSWPQPLQPEGAPESSLFGHFGVSRAVAELLSMIKADARDHGKRTDWVAVSHAIIRNSYQVSVTPCEPLRVHMRLSTQRRHTSIKNWSRCTLNIVN